MKRIIPIFYSEYGRYISRFRAIPSNIDCLKPVERRLLLSLFEVGKKLVKSAKIIGHVIATTHPHGDSCYGTLIQLVYKGLAEGKGNWGSPGLVDAEAAAYRYTESKISDWVIDFAFKYIDYVPWEELELSKEPLYLPCPLPIGLIGHDVIQGISFHRTLIPNYNFKDLAKRCLWVVTKNNDKPKIDYSKDVLDIDTYGPLIKPNIRNCTLVENEKHDFYKLLIEGTGNFSCVPDGHVDLKNRQITLLGKSPIGGFKKLLKDIDDKVLDITSIKDKSDKNVKIVIEIPKKYKDEIQTIANHLWKTYFIKNINFICNFSNHEGHVEIYGIDQILFNCYVHWRYAVLQERIDTFNKINQKYFESEVLIFIKDCIKNKNINTIQEIIDEYNKNNKIKVKITSFDLNILISKNYDWNQLNNYNELWLSYEIDVDENHIKDLCSKKSIKNLVEVKIDQNKIINDINIAKNNIINCNIDCYNVLVEMAK